MSSRAKRSVAEGSFAPGSTQGSARIPPLRLRSGGHDMGVGFSHPSPRSVIPSAAKRSRGIFRTRFDAGHCQDSSIPLRSSRNDRQGGSSAPLPPLCHPERSRGIFRTPVQRRALPGFLHSAYAPVVMTDVCVIPLPRLCHPERSTTPLVIPSAAKRSRGIFRTPSNARHCQDSSTPLTLQWS